MKTTISLSAPAQLETESLVAVVLDHSDKDHSEKDHSHLRRQERRQAATSVDSDDAAVQSAAADLLASGELTGKPFETNLLHKPAGLKAKRLLLVSRRQREEVCQL